METYNIILFPIKLIHLIGLFNKCNKTIHQYHYNKQINKQINKQTNRYIFSNIKLSVFLEFIFYEPHFTVW